MDVRLWLAGIFVVLVSIEALAADGPVVCRQPEQAGFQECVTHCCVLVPEVKQVKKTVYEVHEVPYCVKKLPPLLSLLHHRGCDCQMCAECQCPRYKKVLVKKEVVCKEICTTKCVVEEQRVPCQVCEPACK